MNKSAKQFLLLVVGVIVFILILYYSGCFKGNKVNIIEERLQREGAMDGEIRISLTWDNYNDLDLHVVTPSGERIFFDKKESSDGGVLDVDMNVNYPHSLEPVENIVWPEGKTPPSGTYKVYVNYYRHHQCEDGCELETPFTVYAKVKGEMESFEGVTNQEKENQLIYQFNY